MSEYREQFAYWLKVEGTEEDIQRVYELLCLDKELDSRYDLHCYLVPQEGRRPPSEYAVPDNIGSVEEWYEADQEEVLHKIAMAVPNAVLTLQGECVESRHSSFVFKKQFHGNLYQDVYQETYLPELSKEGFVPFENRLGPFEHKRPSLDELLKELNSRKNESPRPTVIQPERKEEPSR